MTIKDDSDGAITTDTGSSQGNAAYVSPPTEGEPAIIQESSLQQQESPHSQTPLAESISAGETNDNDEEARRVRHWQESVFAVGLVDVTWADSRRKDSLLNKDEGHLKASAWLCPLVGGQRLGNMAVLRQSTGYQEIPSDNGTVERIERPLPTCVLGPYWIVPTLITYPIILVMTFLAARRVVNSHIAIIIVWAVLTVILLTSLSLVACRNPGIMYRYSTIPQEDWRWNDQARTFRPKSAKYDTDCALVVEDFDHTYVFSTDVFKH